jgi:hypothetical protein
MSRGRLLLTLSSLAGGLALAAGPHAALAASTVVERPTSGGTYAYGVPEAAPYVGLRAVVHYVSSGPEAPPLNDDNGDGYPDYVEQVSQAADTALAYYQQYGLKPPLPDTAGPDAKPDIYIDSLPPATFGLTFGSASAEGGTFVLVSPRLDPNKPRAYGSLSTTVAHELAHVIQYSYVVSGRLPVWAAEGSAVALSMLVYPAIQDVVATNYLDAWLRTPWLPLYDERFGCEHCYGGAWWWLYLSGFHRRVLPRYFAQLEADDRAGKKTTSIGVSQLDRALRASGAGTLAQVFSRFSLRLYRRGLQLGLAETLNATTTPHATQALGIYGLSTHYVSVHVPARARGVVVAVPFAHGPAPSVTMIVGGPKGRRVVGKHVRPGKGVLLSTVFRSPAERRRIVLVVTSGYLHGVDYQLGYAAVGPHGRLPGWIAF